MPVDRLYEDIVRRLEIEELNHATFEKIAVRIANSYGPPVLPMPGGRDAGYDGAIVDADGGRVPGVLVATMQENGLGNLRRSLRRHSDTYPEALKTAFFVTTRRKTTTQKQNLIAEADRVGYRMSGVADQPAVAEYLYYNPDACYELLGFRGVPSALSPLPPRRRPYWDVELVSRDAALDRLRNLTADVMLLGIPGSGKTSLLSRVATESLGLFARTADRDRLAPDLRQYRPRAVFVDGLDNQFEAVQALVSLREESGLDFYIVVTDWYEDEAVAQLLDIGPEQRICLERLELNELVEVVYRLGLRGPIALIRNIVHQAGGSPGLAATLTMACRSGNVGEVVTGKILLRHVRTTLKNLSLDVKRAEMALAAIAVGGDSGMKTEDVAEAINMSPLELRHLLRDIEAGGVIRPTRLGNVSVQPTKLRAVLVGANFYGSYPISTRSLLDLAPDRVSALRTLIQAARHGEEPAELRTLLTTVQNPEVFKEYAWLGPEHCRWVVATHPDYLVIVSWPGLRYIPEEILPLLIAEAKGDVRQLHSTPEHPLRIIRDWCCEARPGEGTALPRREMTVKAALRYLNETGDVDTAARAFAQAFTIDYQARYPDPGQGDTLHIERGIITRDDVEGLTGLWQRCVASLRGRNELPWRTLLDTVKNVNLVRPVKDKFSVVDSRVAERRLRNIMAFDIFELGRHHPAVAYEARRLVSQQEKWPAESEEEHLYALLFGDNWTQDYREQEARIAEELIGIAAEWSRMNPGGAMKRLSDLTKAAKDIHHNGIDRRYFFIRQLAEKVEVLTWVRAAVQHNLDYPVVMPLLRRAIFLEECGWEDVALSCLGTPLEAVAVEAALVAGGPSRLMDAVLPLLPKYTGLVGQLCSGQEVSILSIQTLLRHEHNRVAAEAAIHLWYGTEGNIDQQIECLWRDAMLRSGSQSSWIGNILAADPSLSFDWLKRRIETNDWKTLLGERLVQIAAEHLTEEQRFQLLIKITEETQLVHLVEALFGRSVDVYKKLLQDPNREGICLMALARPKDETWAKFIVAGYEHGLSVDKLALASNWDDGYFGSESEYLRKKMEQVSSFLEDARIPIRSVARRMTELLTAQRKRALEEEQEERIWGMFRG